MTSECTTPWHWLHAQCCAAVTSVQPQSSSSPRRKLRPEQLPSFSPALRPVPGFACSGHLTPTEAPSVWPLCLWLSVMVLRFLGVVAWIDVSFHRRWSQSGCVARPRGVCLSAGGCLVSPPFGCHGQWRCEHRRQLACGQCLHFPRRDTQGCTCHATC